MTLHYLDFPQRICYVIQQCKVARVLLRNGLAFALKHWFLSHPIHSPTVSPGRRPLPTQL